MLGRLCHQQKTPRRGTCRTADRRAAIASTNWRVPEHIIIIFAQSRPLFLHDHLVITLHTGCSHSLICSLFARNVDESVAGFLHAPPCSNSFQGLVFSSCEIIKSRVTGVNQKVDIVIERLSTTECSSNILRYFTL